MNYRPFGNTNLRVSEIGFGCSHIGGTTDRQDDAEVLATLEEALASGITLFDTADIYAQGRSERLLGAILRGRRASVVIASKAGYQLSAAGGLMARLKPLVRPLVRRIPGGMARAERVRSSQMRQDFTPQYIRKALDASLRRLRTDYLDIFQLHNPPVSTAQSEDLADLLAVLRSEGKIRCYGVSCTLEDASRWMVFPGISTLHISVNMQAPEESSAAAAGAARRGLAVIARQALASGEWHKLNAFAFLARDHCRSLAQAAIQFALQVPGVSSLVIGMRSRTHLRENLAAANMCLSAADVQYIHSIQTYVH